MKKGGGDAGFDLKAIGVWPGREVTDESQEGSLLAVTSEFQTTSRAHPGKSKPMFFSWNPTSKEKLMFTSKFKAATLHIRVHVMIKTEEAYPGRWMLNFDGVRVIRVGHKNKMQHVEVSYKEFRLENLS
ncbi:MAG: hypothetical protein H7070_03030 [Saprospiraceae bacterium]|nr:hypothetical protein [Pyrinomonadaceae bacterium]